MGIIKTKIIKGKFIGEKEEVISYVSNPNPSNPPPMCLQIDSITVKHYVFETEEGKKSFRKEDLPKSDFNENEEVNIEQKYLKGLGIKIGEKVIIV